jgi:2,3-bisphosphoglycerate-independent phosphoglycerate mutase
MKKIILSALVVIAFALTSCGPTQKDALKYNDDIVSVQKNLTPIHEAFIDQLDGHNIDSLKYTHAKFAESANLSLTTCEKMQPFADKREYLDAAISYFKVVKGLAENEGKNLVEIMSKDSTQVTDDDVAKVNALAARFDSEYEKVLIAVQKAQEAFAKEWKFDLIEKKQ